MHIPLWFRLAAGEGAMNFSFSQKWNPPPRPSRFVLVSFLSVSFFLRLFSNPSCLLSYLAHTLCASHVSVSSYLFLSLILMLSLLQHYILLHNGFSLTLTSWSSSMSTLMCLNVSWVLVSVTLQAHCHPGYLQKLSQHDCQCQGERESIHCASTETQNEFLYLHFWVLHWVSAPVLFIYTNNRWRCMYSLVDAHRIQPMVLDVLE